MFIMSSKRGGFLGSLLLIIFLLAGGILIFLWYKEKPELVDRWMAQDKSRNRGYMTYEEHLRKKEKERDVTELKEKIASFFKR